MEPAAAKGQRVNSSTAGESTRQNERSFAQSGYGGAAEFMEVICIN